MGIKGDFRSFCIWLLYLSITASCFIYCDARKSMRPFKEPTDQKSSIFIKFTKKQKTTKHLGIDPLLDSSYGEPYSVNSPFSLPPYDSLAPTPLPEIATPFCIYPPLMPLPPSTTVPSPNSYSPPSISFPTPISYPPPSSSIPSPNFPIQSPPPSPTGMGPSPPEFSLTPNPPESFSPPSPTGVGLSPPEFSLPPNPPESFPNPPSPPTNTPSLPGYNFSPPFYEPSPPSYIPNPPSYEPSPPSNIPNPPSYEPSPPSFVPSPPSFVPSPGASVPSPPIFHPPVVYPLPHVPPPPETGAGLSLWCVAKPSVPDPIIQEAMNYACGSGADCDSILPSGSCFEPNTLFAHASYAFNSYWQRTKGAGGSCEFGGSSILVTVDPSYDGCHFIYF